MAEGHFNVSRKALRPVAEGGDPFWNEKRVFSRWEAWEFLFGSAARFSEQIWALRSGKSIELQRGETHPLSIRWLAHRWDWSESRVERFMALLFEMERIERRQRTADGDTYVVVNYDDYQGDPERFESETAIGTPTRAATRTANVLENGHLGGVTETPTGAGSMVASGTKQKKVRTEGRVSPEANASSDTHVRVTGSNGNGKPKSGRWMWTLWQTEFGEVLPGLQYTPTRQEKFRMFYAEHLEGKPDPKAAFAEMLKNIRRHAFWGDKPNTWKPEVCMRNPERREEIALGLGQDGGDEANGVPDLGIDFRNLGL